MARLPTPRLPRLGGAAERIRAAGRRLLYAVEDVASALGGGARAAAGAARGAWIRLPPRARQLAPRGLALALLVAVIALVAVPNLPCALPGGDRCPPPDDAAELVPGDALAYVHVNLDPDSEQYRAAVKLARRSPNIASELLARLPSPAGGGLDFGREVEPWLEDEIAVAIVPGEGGAPEQVFLFEVADEAGAEDFRSRLASGSVATPERAGVELQVDERGLATAISGGFLVAGSEIGVQRIVDVGGEEGDSLAGSSAAEAVSEALPDHNFVDAYVSEDGAQSLLAGAGGGLGSLEAFVNFDATSGAGAALVLTGDELELALHSELDPERLEASPGFFEAFPPFEPSLLEELSPDALAYLGLGDPERSVAELLDQAHSSAPALVAGFEDLSKELERSGKVDLEGEVLPVLGGQAALAIEPAPAGGATAPESELPGAAEELPGLDDAPPGAAPPEDVVPPEDVPAAPGVVSASGVPYLTFIASDVDEQAALEAVAKLQGPLAKALEPDATAAQAPVFEEEEVDGVEVRSIRLSPVLNLTFAVFDGKLVISTDPQGVDQVRTGEGELEDSELFERATDDFPDEPAMLAYFNLDELLALAEREGLAEDPAYAVFAADFRQLAAAGLAVEQSGDALDTRLRVALSGEAGSDE